MTEAPTSGKFGYRQLANLARLEAESRRRALHYEIALGVKTMGVGEDAIEAMQEIADILNWLADREIELAEADGYGGDN